MLAETSVMQSAPERETKEKVLSVKDLSVSYKSKSGGRVRVVDKITFDLREGETLGLVGESGCGKSTTAKSIMQLVPSEEGSVFLGQQELTGLSRKALRAVSRDLQIVFQDPISSLNPRRSCGEIVAEPLSIRGESTKEEIHDKVMQALDVVAFDPDLVWHRRPHEFSGGQCQRISLARAVVSEPKVLICDEPVSALDVSVQAQILNLLSEMKQRYNLSLLFVSHDLGVVRYISDRVAVMYLGRMCEIAPTDSLYRQPLHPYTAALLRCVPRIDDPMDYTDQSAGLKGELPSASNPPSGCRFRTRCPKAEKRCEQEVPQLRELAPGHLVACHFPLSGFVPRRTPPDAAPRTPSAKC